MGTDWVLSLCYDGTSTAGILLVPLGSFAAFHTIVYAALHKWHLEVTPVITFNCLYGLSKISQIIILSCHLELDDEYKVLLSPYPDEFVSRKNNSIVKDALSGVVLNSSKRTLTKKIPKALACISFSIHVEFSKMSVYPCICVGSQSACCL